MGERHLSDAEFKSLPRADDPLFSLHLAPRENSNVRPFPAHVNAFSMSDLARKIVSGCRGSTLEAAIERRARELSRSQIPLSVAMDDLAEYERVLIEMIAAAIRSQEGGDADR